jgi:hypothetical protein
VQVVSLVVSVLHELEGLEMGTRDVEALKEEGSRLNAPNYGVSGDGGGLRGSCFAEAFLASLVGDGGVFEGPFSSRMSGIAGMRGEILVPRLT